MLMSFMEKLARLVGTPAALQREVGGALADCYVVAAVNSKRLQQDAEYAPNEASAQGLKDLAASEEALSQRLLEALKAAGKPSPKIEIPNTPRASSHWGRLVQALEAHRALVQAMRDHAAEFVDTFPATAQLFEELRAIESMHCEGLRALIARADPQAMD